MPDGSLGGPWNYTNAASFIRYTVNRRYTIHGWELGKILGASMSISVSRTVDITKCYSTELAT